MYYNYKISDETVALAEAAERDLTKIFKDIEDNALKVSGKILSAFQELRVSSADFVDITGYGYSDPGRDKLGGRPRSPSAYVGHTRAIRHPFRAS